MKIYYESKNRNKIYYFLDDLYGQLNYRVKTHGPQIGKELHLMIVEIKID